MRRGTKDPRKAFVLKDFAGLMAAGFRPAETTGITEFVRLTQKMQGGNWGRD
jgi:hypothetical protein